jgi:hypothetical protein
MNEGPGRIKGYEIFLPLISYNICVSRHRHTDILCHRTHFLSGSMVSPSHLRHFLQVMHRFYYPRFAFVTTFKTSHAYHVDRAKSCSNIPRGRPKVRTNLDLDRVVSLVIKVNVFGQLILS